MTTKWIGSAIISLLIVTLCYVMTWQIRIIPLEEGAQPVDIMNSIRFLIMSTIPLSLIVIGTTLIVRIVWKAKWQ